MKLATAIIVCGLLTAGLLSAAGCSATDYAHRRACDFGDVFRFHVGSGHGILANVHASRYVAVGVGEYSATRYGVIHGRYGAWQETRGDMNLVVPFHGYTDVNEVYAGNVRRTRLQSTYRQGVRYTIYDEMRGLAELSVNAHVLVIGLDAGIDVGEFGDFLLGIAGIDAAGDDYDRVAEGANASAPYRRARAARLLGNRPGPDAERALAKLMHDEVAEVRAQAVRSLGRIGTSRTLPVIAEAVEDEDAGVRQEARRAIETITNRRFLDEADLKDWLDGRSWYTEPDKESTDN